VGLHAVPRDVLPPARSGRQPRHALPVSAGGGELRGGLIIASTAAMACLSLSDDSSRIGLIVLSALKSSVSVFAQGFLSLLAALVIARLAAIRATAIAPETDIVAGHAFAHLDFEVRAAFDTGCRNVPNALTG